MKHLSIFENFKEIPSLFKGIRTDLASKWEQGSGFYFQRMEHLKLFESFNNDGKIDLVNNILIEYFLFNYFVKNDIFVERNYKFLKVVYDFWFRQSWGIIAFLSYDVDKSFVEPTGYTEYHLTKAFLGYIDQLDIEKIAEKVHRYNGIKRAMNNYIEFLTNTPDKNHLLHV